MVVTDAAAAQALLAAVDALADATSRRCPSPTCWSSATSWRRWLAVGNW